MSRARVLELSLAECWPCPRACQLVTEPLMRLQTQMCMEKLAGVGGI